MFPDQGPEPAAPRLADEDVAAVAVGQPAEAVVAAGALIVAKAGRRAVGVRVRALERGRRRGPCARERRVPHVGRWLAAICGITKCLASTPKYLYR